MRARTGSRRPSPCSSPRSEEHTSELQSLRQLVCRLLLEKKKFAEETRALLGKLVHSHSHICYSAPDSQDQLNANFDTRGRLDRRVLESLRLHVNRDYYI